MTLYQFTNKRSRQIFEIELLAYWEVALESIDDDYTPDVIADNDLLRLWGTKVKSEYPNQLIPIYWYITGDKFQPQRMPFQYDHGADNDEVPEVSIADDNFLTHFTHPVNSETKEKINWLSLSVVDKTIEKSQEINSYPPKGNFIQRCTGWKPSILQPFVYLPSLLETR